MNELEHMEQIRNSVNEYTYIAISSIRTILLQKDYKDLEIGIDNLFYSNDGYVDTMFLMDDLVVLCKEHAINFINNNGLLLDIERAMEISIEQLSYIVISINDVSNMGVSDAIYVSAILEEDISDIDKIYFILFYFNPDIDKDVFYTYVTDVMPKLINNIITITTNVIKNEDIEEISDDVTELTDTTINLIDKINELGFYNLPKYLLLLVTEPTYINILKEHSIDILNVYLKEIDLKLKTFLNEDDGFNKINFLLFYSLDLIMLHYIINKNKYTVDYVIADLQDYLNKVEISEFRDKLTTFYNIIKNINILNNAISEDNEENK